MNDISVIIPYYNREEYIDEAVQSVLSGSLQPLEIIIVNDCSREASRRYLDRYSNVCRIIDLRVNVGLGGARNAGIREAKGRFIALLDDDDIWFPHKLEVQRRYMEEHPECALVHSAVWAFFSNKRELLWECFDYFPLPLAQALTHEQWVIPSTILIRAEVLRALGGFDPHLRENEDRDFIVRCCAAGYRVEGIHQPLARMRRGDHARLTKNKIRMFLAHTRMCWRYRSLYYRAYGMRGIVSFLVQSLHIATMQTRYLDGAVRRLLKLVKVKYDLKPEYREPVLPVSTKKAPAREAESGPIASFAVPVAENTSSARVKILR